MLNSYRRSSEEPTIACTHYINPYLDKSHVYKIPIKEDTYYLSRNNEKNINIICRKN